MRLTGTLYPNQYCKGDENFCDEEDDQNALKADLLSEYWEWSENGTLITHSESPMTAKGRKICWMYAR